MLSSHTPDVPPVAEAKTKVIQNKRCTHSFICSGSDTITLGEQKRGTKQLQSAVRESSVKEALLQSADRCDLEPEGHPSAPAITRGGSN